MLLRLYTRSTSGVLADMQETPDLVAKLRQRLVIGGSVLHLFISYHDIIGFLITAAVEAFESAILLQGPVRQIWVWLDATG